MCVILFGCFLHKSHIEHSSDISSKKKNIALLCDTNGLVPFLLQLLADLMCRIHSQILYYNAFEPRLFEISSSAQLFPHVLYCAMMLSAFWNIKKGMIGLMIDHCPRRGSVYEGSVLVSELLSMLAFELIWDASFYLIHRAVPWTHLCPNSFIARLGPTHIKQLRRRTYLSELFRICCRISQRNGSPEFQM